MGKIRNTHLISIAKLMSSNIFSSATTYISLLILGFTFDNESFGEFSSVYYILGISYVLLDLGLPNALVLRYSQWNSSFRITDLFKKFFMFYLITCLILYLYLYYSFSILISLSIIVSALAGLLLKFNSTKLQVIGDWGGSASIIFYLPMVRSVAILTFCLFIYFSAMVNKDYIYVFLAFASMFSAGLSYFRTKQIDYTESKLDGVLTLAWKLYLANLLAIICMRADVILISHFFDSETAGKYAKISIIFFAAPVVISAINTVFVRELSAKKVKREDISALSTRLLKLVAIFVMPLVSIFAVLYFRGVIPIERVSFSIIILLLLSYSGALVMGVWESYIIKLSQNYFLLIKAAQLSLFLLVFISTFRTVGVISAAIAFLSSRMIGWILVIIFINKKQV
ncbi:lipopolysaccharide biosynthesis protein [Serratia fonticola]